MAISDRGFASMDKNKQREIASKGGKSSGSNFRNDPERARAAGKKGAQAQPRAAKVAGGHSRHRSV